MRRRFLKICLALTSICCACLIAYYFLSHRESSPISLDRQGQATLPTKLQLGAPGSHADVKRWAGEGIAGWLDGEKSRARFADPFGLVADSQGNLYVADGGDNNRIRKVSREGIVTTFAGGHEGFADGSSTAAFNTPSGLALDDSGNVYVADTGNNAIRKITPQGIVSTLAGNGSAGNRDGVGSQAQFNGPLGVAVDHDGNVYVADTYNDRIRRISPAGQVTTLAGGNTPGYVDGPAATALFDTPCALAVDTKGMLYIADTRNNAIRTLSNNGQVGTLVRTLPNDRTALWRRPIGLAFSPDGLLYVGEMGHGRIIQISPNGELHGLTGVGIDFPVGDNTALRFSQPVGIVFDKDGALLIADSTTFAIRKVTAHQENSIETIDTHDVVANSAQSAVSAINPPMTAQFPWPLKPQNEPHEIVGTMGEVRGNTEGESRDHFHAGLDVRANMGTPVLAVAAEKISDPLPSWGYGDLSEGLSIHAMSYIHMRVGRTAKEEAIDPARFSLITDADGKPRVRVKRGTRFAVGDPLGTVNRMYHVHLEFSPVGAAVNPLSLGFKGYKDSLAPHIESIQLFNQNGLQLSKKQDGKLWVPRDAGALNLVVGAYDQIDGNEARRRLGLYKLGFQILHDDGTPVPGFEQPQTRLEFNQLPPDRETVKIAYADGSGETVHGSASTRFLYAVTNTVRNGHAKAGTLSFDKLPSGAYLIRILAADFAGNMATSGRDLPIMLE